MEASSKAVNPGIIELKLAGSIDEKSIFPKYEDKSLTRLLINMDGVNRINSMGILHWIRWWKELVKRNPSMTFQVEKVRMPLMSCASIVSGFLPENTEILSFYLNYHCEERGLNHQELLQLDVDYNAEVFKLKETIIRTVQGQEVEFEVDCFPSRDLRALGLKIEKV